MGQSGNSERRQSKAVGVLRDLPQELVQVIVCTTDTQTWNHSTDVEENWEMSSSRGGRNTGCGCFLLLTEWKAKNGQTDRGKYYSCWGVEAEVRSMTPADCSASCGRRGCCAKNTVLYSLAVTSGAERWGQHKATRPSVYPTNRAPNLFRLHLFALAFIGSTFFHYFVSPLLYFHCTVTEKVMSE